MNRTPLPEHETARDAAGARWTVPGRRWATCGGLPRRAVVEGEPGPQPSGRPGRQGLVTHADLERDEAFDAFVVAASGKLLGTALLLTGDRGAAEDLLQDVLERLYVAWPRVRDPLAYARRSLAHGATSRWRYRARRVEVPLTQAHELVGDDRSEDALDRERVLHALRQLPPRQRAVVVLRFLEDQTEAQTALLLRVSAGTVKSQSSRGLERLRALLIEPEVERNLR